ncbi:MAG TPA: rhodanese-like domain-containing protein [Kofleriaceae bacterium]
MRFLLIGILAVGCASSSSPPPAPTATKDVATAKTWIASGAAIIDVRTPDEFAEGHLERAINIPVQELPQRVADVERHLGGDKTARLVLYCASGQRAGKAKQQLDAAGYTNVVNGGGLDDLEP